MVCKNWILFIMTITFQPLFYMQCLSFITALSFAASSHRKPATTRTSCDSYNPQDSNKRNTIMRLFYRVCGLSYCSLSCLAPCCSHIISKSMCCYERKVVVKGKKIFQFQFNDGSVANINYSQVNKWRQLLLYKKQNHITVLSVKWREDGWKLGIHLKSLTHTHTHISQEIGVSKIAAWIATNSWNLNHIKTMVFTYYILHKLITQEW